MEEGERKGEARGNRGREGRRERRSGGGGHAKEKTLTECEHPHFGSRGRRMNKGGREERRETGRKGEYSDWVAQESCNLT